MSDPKDKEQAIITAARRMFALHGYSQARVEDIAQAAGVGKGTVYEYFSSKQAMFEQVVEAGMSQYMESLGEQIQMNCSPTAKLEGITTLHLEFVTQYQNLANIIIADPAIMSPHRLRLRKICRQAQQMVVGVMEQGIREGAFRPVDPLLATQSFFGILSSVGVMQLVQEQRWKPEAVAAQVTDLIVNGLGKA
ncbi:MAG TPA: TetR/AcrR family transcriptional regulator [bacterium]|nr:TetR/AcrR family transcriptional regulator [bacterium]